MIVPVIMAGGSGSRLWPLSRSHYPKQFLPLVNDSSMLQDTCARLQGVEHQPPVFVCGEDHRFIVAEQLREANLEHGGILLEPVGRNTAPAIALAAMQVLQSAEQEDPILLVLAADHVINDVEAFQQSVVLAKAHAAQGRLVTFGIEPTAAETGYGYIRKGERSETAYRVAEFVEKPDQSTAESYLAAGEYLWNSGMFMFSAKRYLEELKAHRPDIFAACEKSMASAAVDADFVRPEAGAFTACPDDSIDYAVMERTADAVVVPMSCGWSDVGSWSALWDVAEKDVAGNAVVGDVMTIDSRDCYVRSDSKLIATIGLSDVVVVESDDAILVAQKDQVQKVKTVVERLKASQRSETQLHRKVYRPWGYYDSIDSGSRFQVKRIVVTPGAELSLQMHHHRAEHWVVVSGTAEVTCGESIKLVTENESTYIPLGTKHRLKNPGAIPLEMIEVQSGSYLGEDDIVRFEDTYGRG